MSISILNRGASGGLKPELTVAAPSGSTIDLLQNGIIVDTYTLGASETEHTFVVKVGTYTVRGTLGEQNRSVEVVIDAVGQYVCKVIYGTPIGELAVGSTVKTNVNGTVREFLVVNQCVPSNSGLYDSSCNGTWLLMNALYENRSWDSSNNDYANSDIHAYLNGTFLGLFDDDVQSAIKLVKIPYVNGTGSGGTTATGPNGLSTKIFLLSGYEVGFTTSVNSNFIVDGAKLEYFISGDGNSAMKKRALGVSWWLRSAYKNKTDYSWLVVVSGSCNNGGCYDTFGVRPAFVMPFDALVNDDGMLIVN